ncbi:MAG TPA: B12-binding domain-containing radical SAM protein [Cyclobacteriaceae bacterium]
MKVLLTHGYFLQEDEKEKKIMRPYPPLGILYISAFLNENKIHNRVFDSTFSTREALYREIAQYQPELLAIYTNLMTKVNVLQIIDQVKKFHTCKIALGGPDVTYNVDNYLNAGADYIVIGEGEVTMLELAETLECKKSVKNVDGLAYYDEKGVMVQARPRTMLKNIDELPIPNRDALDVSQYLKAWKEHHGLSALNVSTQRGCPYTCKWCSTAVYGQSYRRRSPEHVILELKEIKEKYKPDSIWFVDDVFTVSHKWLSEMADAMDKNNIRIQFECISRADRMNASVIKTLKKMGCFRVWIGAESGSQKIIDAMDRRVTVEKVREMIQETRKQGIEAGTFIMLGYPGETEDDIKETLRHLKVSNPDYFTITKAYPIKGTALYEEVESTTTEDLDWNLNTDRNIDFKRAYSRKYYDYAIKWVVNEVNYSKRKREFGIDKLAIKYKLKAIYSNIGMSIAKSGI